MQWSIYNGNEFYNFLKNWVIKLICAENYEYL